MKKLFFISILAIFTSFTNAQNLQIPQNSVQIPKNYSLEKAEDYAPYEQDIVNCINWLMESPPNEMLETRQEAWLFYIRWITGCPYVTVVVSGDIVTFMDKKNPDLLFIFMAGWTKQTIESKDDKDLVKGNMAGIEAVIKYYTKNKEIIGNNKAVEKYIKMKESGKMEAFITKQCAKIKR